MHYITGQLLNIAQGRKNDGELYQVLQILSPPTGLIHKITGVIMSSYEATMEGKPCKVVKMISYGGNYASKVNIVDFNISRKWANGESTIYCKPTVHRKGSKPIAIFIVCDSQDDPKSEITDDLMLLTVKDYENLPFETGIVTVPVKFKPFIGLNSSGLNYFTVKINSIPGERLTKPSRLQKEDIPV